MKGSEKQIKWANEIKKEMLEVVEKHISYSNTRRIEMGKSPLSETSLSYRTINQINEIEEATWFINHRRFQKAYDVANGSEEATNETQFGEIVASFR